MKRVLILILLCSLLTPLLQAQGRGKLSNKRKHPRTPHNTTAPLSRYGGTHGALLGVDYYLTREPAPLSTKSLPLTAATRPKRSIFNRLQRNLKAWHLHQKRKRLDLLALRENLEKQAIANAKANLPALQPERAFTVENLQNIVPIHTQQPVPEIPFVAEPGKIAFRGLALRADATAIRNILTNGLRTQDVGGNNSAFLHSISAGMQGITRQLSALPSISITHHPAKANKWGEIRLHPQKNPILTIVKIKGDFQGQPVEFVMKDIAVHDIEEVIVRVNLQGNLTWCRVILNPDNTLTLIPYERTGKQINSK